MSSACPQRHVHRVHRGHLPHRVQMRKSSDAPDSTAVGVTVETTRETLPDSTAGPASLHARSARLGRSPRLCPCDVRCFESPQQSGQSLTPLPPGQHK